MKNEIKKSKLTNRLTIVFLLYLGGFCLIISYLFYRQLYQETLSLLNSIGVLCIICGTFFWAFDKLSQKLDSFSDNISALNELGIEQIIPYKGKKLDSLFTGNREIRIIINANRLDSIGVIIDSIKELSKTTISILVLGKIPEEKNQTLDRYHRFFECRIKTTEKSGIDNFAILDNRICEFSYSDYDSDIEYICVFYASSEYGLKCRSLFEDLWNDNKTKLYI